MKPQPIRFISPSSRPVGPPSRLCVAQAAFTATGVRPAAAAPSSLVIAVRRLIASIMGVLLPYVKMETAISVLRLIENSAGKKTSPMHEHELRSCGDSTTAGKCDVYSGPPQRRFVVRMRNHHTRFSLGLFFLLLFFAASGVSSQEPPSDKPPDNVAGKWTLYC